MSYGHPYQYNPDQPYGSTPTTPASFVAWDLQEQDASFQPPPPQQDANPPQQPQAFNPGVPTVPIPQRVSTSSQGLFRLRDYVHQPSVEPPIVGEDSVDRLQSASGGSPSLPGPHRSAPVRETRAAHPYRRSSGSEGVAQRLRRGVHEPSSSGSHLRVSIPAIIGPTAITLPCPGQEHTASVGVPPASGSRYAPPFPCNLSVVGTDLATFFSFLPLPLARSLNSSELPFAPLSLQPAVVERNYAIRADVFYDKDANLMKAMLELPGLKKSDLKITLSRCPYTCVKQLTVSGKSKPVFPDVGLAVKERRFGRFYRTMAVPSDTTVRLFLFLCPICPPNKDNRSRRLSRICKTVSSPSSSPVHRLPTPTRSPPRRFRSRENLYIFLTAFYCFLSLSQYAPPILISRTFPQSKTR